MKRFPERLILSFGLGIAVAAFVFWTAFGWIRFRMWIQDGVHTAVVALGATLFLALLVRFAFWFTNESGKR